jgi:spermidine synthase
MPGIQLNTDLWFSEYLTPYDVYQHGIRAVLAHKKTAFQEMYIIDTGTYGTALVLDGQWQSSSGDEFLYHEPLVHPACVNHGAPKRVLLLGAGEGATLREVLKWQTVEKVVMVDIDAEVVEACRQHLTEMHQNAFDDPRAELIIADALGFLDDSEHEWDIIISDLSDPIEAGPSFQLFTKEYFEKCRRALRPDGYFVVQAGSVSPVKMGLHVRLVNTVQAVFANVVSYSSHIPTYGTPWGFIMGSAQAINRQPGPAEIDALLAAKTNGKFRMFDGITLLGLMQTPKHIRQAIAAETDVYTLANPPGLSVGTG